MHLGTKVKKIEGITIQDATNLTTYIHGLIAKGETKGHSLLAEWTTLVKTGTVDVNDMSAALQTIYKQIKSI